MGNISYNRRLYNLNLNEHPVNSDLLTVYNECKSLISDKKLNKDFSPIDYLKISIISDKSLLVDFINSLIEQHFFLPVSHVFTTCKEQNIISPSGFTYFVLDNLSNYIKIGFSGDVKTRLRQLKVANPHISLLGFIPGNYEDCFHKRFKHLNISGEWFNVTYEDIQNYKKEIM